MLARLSRAHLILPGLLSLVALSILIGLGVWQLQRKTWKEGLIAAIEAGTKAEPISIAEALAKAQRGEDIEYLRVRAEGRFVHEREFLLYAPSVTEGPGYHVYTPMEVFTPAADGSGAETPRVAYLIVNRGFVPERLKEASARPEGLVNDSEIPSSGDHAAGGHVRGAVVTGLLRKPEAKGLFTPDNDPVRDIWYWRDLDAMSRALGARVCGGADVTRPFCGGSGYPFFLEADATAVPGGWPRGGVTIVELPNRHLEYALTWFGLAGALAAVFVLFARSRLSAE